MKFSFLLLFTLLLSACSTQSELVFDEIFLITQNPSKLTFWYENNLGFDVSSKQLLLQNGFKITLIKDPNAIPKEQLKKDLKVKYVPGFFKFGFLTNQFDRLLDHLQKNQVEIVGNVFTDNVLDRKTVIIKDPDDNYIQLFEDWGTNRLKPYYLSLIVENIGEQEKWYQMKLPMLHTHTFDQPENNTYIRVIEGKDFLFELIQPNQLSLGKEHKGVELTGIHQINISGAKASFERDHENNKIVNP